MTESASSSPRAAYHLRRASTLLRRLKFEAPRLTEAEAAALTSRINHHRAKARQLESAPS